MNEKLKAWFDSNDKLANKMDSFCNAYRDRNCYKCTIAMRLKRVCRTYSSKKRYCDSMINARTRKFKEDINRSVINLIKVEQKQ